MLLEENGYKVLTAASGKAALQFLSRILSIWRFSITTCPQRTVMWPRGAYEADKPDVPIALLSGDEWLPPSALEPVDAFISKS
jgi:CheY-like chemotaxis protein